MLYIIATWLLAPLWWPVALIRRIMTPAPRRIVIFEIAGIGDVVCSTYHFARLRARYPDTLIDLVVDPIAASLAPALPMLNRVISFPYARQRGLIGRLRLAQICLGYDTAICLIPSAAQLTAFCLAAVPRRLSVLPEPLSNSYRSLRLLLTDVALHTTGQYFLQTQASLFTKLSVHAAGARKWMPSPQPDTPAHSRVPKLTDTTNIGVLVSSGRALKRIEPDKLAAIITQLLAHTTVGPLKIVLIGGPGDLALVQSIVALLPEAQRTHLEDTVGRYTLNELPALLTQLAILIGVDSGVTHMADALGVPVVCVAGPVDLSEVYQAGDCRQLVSADLPCYPCSTVFVTPSQCRTSDMACLRQLNTSHIVQTAWALIQQTENQ